MAAGSVSVPQVIPLRIPLPGRAKRRIDSGTRVEIKSDTPEVSIYYTLDGSKPELFRKPGYGEHNTFKYKSPILLPVGKITVKALAVTKQLVPMNTPICIVCESPIDLQLQPQANTYLKAKSLQTQLAWQPLPNSLSKSREGLKETEDKGTQTVGLFYPSSKLLEKKELELVLHQEKLQKMSDHKPLLTAISPGKGYWRKQLDHVCAHLRSYAQNNPEFRALIGEPRMGKITSAAIHENDHQVTITLNYALAINKAVHTKPVKFNNHYLNSVTEGRDEQDGSQDSSGKDDHLSYSRGKIKTTESRTLTEKEDNFLLESRQLLDELGPHGKGRIALIEQLLSEGADPNCTSDEDRPALTVAVLNRHAEVISLLVQKGADIDQQSGLHNNTALHEAVLLGLEGEECIRALLRCNASIKTKNTKGQSAYDLAVTAGSNEVISLFASELGQEMLDILTKPQDIGLVSI
ncbi:UNVERIFIED_CONTAM: hypothetical protein H355_003731 [Colinus virginianus]|nr:hypothetical protein H355_003731 [Colinus virginianus]